MKPVDSRTRFISPNSSDSFTSMSAVSAALVTAFVPTVPSLCTVQSLHWAPHHAYFLDLAQRFLFFLCIRCFLI